jgi:hypothetical protein
MATKIPSAPSATISSGHVIARPILQSSPKLKLANGETTGCGADSVSDFFCADSPASAGSFRRAEFHSMRAFSTIVSARVSSIWKFSFVQCFVADVLDFFERATEVGERFDHLFGIATRVELGFFEQTESARKIVNHFLAAVLKFKLAAAQFLERGAFAFQILLRAFQLGEFLLRLDDFAVHFVARGRAERIVGRRRKAYGDLCA